MKKKLSIIVLALFLLNGCAYVIPQPDRTIVNNRTFEVSYDVVWNAMLRAFNASGELITVAQKDSGLITFQKKVPLEMLGKVSLAPKGVVALANHWVIVFPIAQINVTAQKLDDKRTLVIINAKIVGDFGKPWTNFRAQELASNGVLEKEYLDKIQKNLSK
jgi:hypothetical protein